MDTETALLGVCLSNSDVFPQVLSFLSEKHFQIGPRRTVFDACRSVWERDGKITLVAVVDHLKAKDLLTQVGGVPALIEWIDIYTPESAVPLMIRSLRVAEVRGRISQYMSLHASELGQGDPSALDGLAALSRECQIEESEESPSFTGQVLDAIESLDKLKDTRSLKTGFEFLDRLTGGFRPGEVCSLGGRTGLGKTALMVKMAYNMGLSGGKVYYFSTEMGASELIRERIFPFMSGIPSYKFRAGAVNPSEVVDFGRSLSKLDIFIDDNPFPGLSDIRRALAVSTPAVVFVDYIQRCRLPEGDSRAYQIQDFMREIKTIARQSNAVVVIACQMRRDVDYGTSKDKTRPPVLADLRDSGAIEQESDQVILVWPAEAEGACYSETRLLNLTLAKNRHGQDGTVQVRFNRPIMDISTQNQMEGSLDGKENGSNEAANQAELYSMPDGPAES